MNDCSPKVIKGTTAIWAANDSNPIPLGVFCIEILENDTVKMKVGDGIHKFSELQYYIDALSSSQIPTWKPNTTYSINTLVSYNGELYLSKDNIVASSVFDDSKWRTITNEGLEATIESKLSKSAANKNLLTDITVSATSTSLKLTKPTYNLGTAQSGTSEIELPLADGSSAGIMPPSAFNQISDNTQRIASLEGRVVLFLVSFDSCVDPSNPSQGELTNIFKEASSLDAPFNGASLIGSGTNTNKYIYYSNASKWQIDTSGSASIATKDTVGIVKGSASTEKGKVFVELDGSMSVIGYAEITEGKTFPSAGLTTKDEDTSENTQISTLSTVNDDYKGFQDEKKVVHLQVKESGLLQDNISGFMVNGVRIDFDHKSLLIKTASEQKTIPLSKGPYKVTSPYATVEMYGHLFIFDESTEGKGIIRKPDGSILEVEDLGIYCPNSSVNVIHVLDTNDEEVCYILNDENQSKTLCVYPDGTYKVCDFGKASRTPQNISSLELLTSVDGTRHSYFMYDNHPLGTATNIDVSEYILFQLEDCTFQVLDATTASCDPQSTGTFNPAVAFGNYRLIWEGHTDLDDYEPESKNVIDTTYADSTNLNKRLPYKTGQWQTEAGSVMQNRRIIANHNGVYNFDIGAKVLFDNFTTNRQAILITPEGFIGWFELGTSLAQWYNKDFREIEIQSGPYKGKRGILIYSIDRSNRTIFIVNTHDGNPKNTVCVSLNTNTNNLYHVSGKNVIAAAYNFRPTLPYVDGLRVYLGEDAASGFSSGRYFTYFNQSEIAPNTYSSETQLWTQNFDVHCIDSSLDCDSVTNMNFLPCYGWGVMEHLEFGEGGGNGTLVKGAYNVDVFLPNEEDTWDGSQGIRPYFVRRANDANQTLFQPVYSGAKANYLKYMKTRVNWNNHHIQCLGAVATPVTTTYALDYYFDTNTNRIKCKAITFATGFMHFPIVIDSKYLILWASNNTARCVALKWDAETNDYEVTDGGDWVPPQGTTGHLLYVKHPTEDETIAGVKNKLYFFDIGTAKANYLRLTYTENEEGVATPEYTTYSLPKSMQTGHLIAYSGNTLLLTEASSSSSCYYLTLEVSSTINVSYPTAGQILDVYDITNTNNSSETSDGAYALFLGDVAFFYVLERDSVTKIPMITKYPTRAKVQRRIWALPSEADTDGIKPMRFAIGSNNTTASTASSPITIIERIGGTITEETNNPINFTRVRDFGTEANSSEAQTARVDLAVPSYIWSEPQLCAVKSTSVRFMSAKTPKLGDAYSQKQDAALLGYKNGKPIYGERVVVNTGQANYSDHITSIDNSCFIVGTKPEEDSFISFFSSYGCAYKIADNWTAFKEDKEFYEGSTFKGGPVNTVWLTNQATDNYYGRSLQSLVIEGEIVTSTVTGHVAKQRTHMAKFDILKAAIAGGSLTTFGPQDVIGFNSIFKIRSGRIMMRSTNRTTSAAANWSINEPPTIFDMERNTPYTGLTAAQYVVASGTPVVPVFETTARTPIYDLYTNQIMPGVYYKKNNQTVPNYSGAEAALVPYFMFTDDDLSMVFKNIDGTEIDGITPFTGNVQCSHQREGETSSVVFMTREVYDPESGDAVVMCFYKEGNIGKYRELKVTGANELIERVYYNNGHMELSGLTKRWKLDLSSFAITIMDLPPYTSALVSFDKGTDLASLIKDDAYNLHAYSPQQLVIEYQGEQYHSIPLTDLVLRGQTTMDYATVNNLNTSVLEANKIILTSKYPRVTY